MIALLAAAAVFVDAFWARDVGQLARDLVEHPEDDGHRAVFSDLVRLVTCAPLERSDEPLRVLLRVEEARHRRLGAAAAQSPTIWRDILRPGFFSLQPKNPPGGLSWPAEEERWPGEVDIVDAPVWACGNAAAPGGDDELALLTPALLAALPQAGRAHAAYERAVLLYRNGDLAGADALDPAALEEPLASAAQLMRLERGQPVDAVALLRGWPLADRTAILLRAAEALHRTRRMTELAALEPGTRPSEARRAAMWDHVQLLRGLAFVSLERPAEAMPLLVGVLESGRGRPELDPVRALVIDELGRGPLDTEALRVISVLAGRANQGLLFEAIARAALAVGSLDTAQAAAERWSATLDARSRTRTAAVEGEIALRRGDRLRYEAAWDVVQRDEGSLLQLSHASVVHAEPRWRKSIEARLLAALDRAHKKARPALEADLAALRASDRPGGVVALPSVRILRAPEPPPSPPLAFDPPEPRSVLAIPTHGGGLQDWFEGDKP